MRARTTSCAFLCRWAYCFFPRLGCFLSSFLTELFVSRYVLISFLLSHLQHAYPCLRIQSCLLLHTYIPFFCVPFLYYSCLSSSLSIALALALKTWTSHSYIISTISFPLHSLLFITAYVFFFVFVFSTYYFLRLFFCLFVCRV